MPISSRLRTIVLAAALPAVALTGATIASGADGPEFGPDTAVAAPVAATEPFAEGPSLLPPAPGATPLATPLSTVDAPPVTQVLVRFRAGTRSGERRSARRSADADFVERLPVRGLQLVDPEPGVAVRETVAQLERSPDVLYAEPDAVRSATATANDTFFGRQWGLDNTGQPVSGTSGTLDADIDAPEAWELTTGSAGVAVGILDSGVESTHPDLAPNIRANLGEIAGNGRDDDGNGYVDDVSGWDWVDYDNVPQDLEGHGTHVAGTVGARGNDGTGVTGVAWRAGLVPLRVLDENGYGTVSDIIQGYAYARSNGIRVVNASFGDPGFSRAEFDALAASPGVLFVVAAGNDGADNDSIASYPCNYSLANVVCVAASDQSDRLAGFSNYGAATVDLAAPGTNIASTYPNFDCTSDPGPDWVYLNGTSMATPHVAGAAALVWSLRPGSTVADVRAALLGNVDVKSSLSGRVATGGRLNVYRALGGASGTPVTPPSATSAPPTKPCSERIPTPTAPAPAPASAPTPDPERTTPEPPTAVPPEPVDRTTTHRPRAFRARRGRIVRRKRSVKRLFRDDRRRLEMTPRRARRRYVAVGLAGFRLGPTERSDLTRIGLTYDGGASRRGLTAKLRIYDWRGRRWRTLATLRNARRDRTVRRAITRRASRYVSSRGLVRISIRSVSERRVRTRADLLRISTR